MDLLNENTKKIFFRYLLASFLSALISSIYSVVDMAMVGQHLGSNGSAAMAVVAPLWNIIFSLGLLTGMGGAILYAKAKGEGKSQKEINGYFTLAMILTGIISVILWIVVLVFENDILVLFGASETLMPLAKSYLTSVKYAIPVFLFNQAIACFLRNDNDPLLATIAIVCGGVFNVLADYLLVFTANMGMNGAGIATVGCNAISLLICCTHFLKKKNTLRLTSFTKPLVNGGTILLNGFPSFLTDASMGIVTIVFNSQIMHYFDESSLAVYGVIININTFVQCCAYGVGQGCQPLISINYGAHKISRVKQFLKYSVLCVTAISLIWLSTTLLFPNGFINLFMKADEKVLAVAPSIMRSYCLSFIFLPFNVLFVYFFQSITHSRFSLLLSCLRGLIILVPLIFLLPLITPSLIWYSALISEGVVFALASVKLFLTLRAMDKVEKLAINH